MNKIYLIGLIVLALLVGGGIYWYSQQFPGPAEVVTPEVKEKPLPANVTDASQTVIEEILLEANELGPLPEEDANFLEEATAAYEEEPFSGL